MKRTILATLFLASISFVSLNAQPSATQETIVTATAEETPVKPADLPESVKKTLASDVFAKWSIAAASVVKEGENEYYKVDLVNGEEKQTVKLDKEGQLIK